MMRTGIVRSECWKNENINVRLIWPKRDMLKSLHRVQLLTLTPKYPAKRRAPMTMSREPIKKRTVAKAMALYGTFGGLFLNCRGEIWWNYERNAHLLTIRDDSEIHALTTYNWINWAVFNSVRRQNLIRSETLKFDYYYFWAIQIGFSSAASHPGKEIKHAVEAPTCKSMYPSSSVANLEYLILLLETPLDTTWRAGIFFSWSATLWTVFLF